jgi:hypothetical protein
MTAELGDTGLTYEEALEELATSADMEGLGYGIMEGYVDETLLPSTPEGRELFRAIQDARAALNFIDSRLRPYYP